MVPIEDGMLQKGARTPEGRFEIKRVLGQVVDTELDRFAAIENLQEIRDIRRSGGFVESQRDSLGVGRTQVNPMSYRQFDDCFR